MNVKIFVSTAGNNVERDVLKKFYHGIEPWINDQREFDHQKQDPQAFLRFDRMHRRPQHSVEFDYSDQYTDCDVAVIMGSWKSREKGHHPVRTSIVDNARCFVCIETPLLARRMFRQHDYYRLGVNGFLNGDAYWNAYAKSSDRFNAMGLAWDGWKDPATITDQDHIIVAMQLAGDASMRYNDINDWCVDTVKKIREHTSRPILIRFHPAISERGWADYIETFKQINFGGYANVQFSDGKSRSWEQDIDNAYCVVAYSSGLSIDAIYSGIPVIACDKGNFAWNISSRFPEDINNLLRVPEQEVLQWLHNLAYCQWSPAEMSNGQAWAHLLPAIEQVLENEP